MAIELLNMDCMDYMRDCEDNKFKITVTSPPYGNLRDYGDCEWTLEKSLNVISEIYRVTSFGGVLVWNVSDQVLDGGESLHSFKQAIHAVQCGFKLHDTMIWKKSGVNFPCPTRYHDSFEYMFVFVKGKIVEAEIIKDRPNIYHGHTFHGTDREKDGSTRKSTNSGKGKKIPPFGARYNVWEIPNVGDKTIKHPAKFPIQIPFDHMRTWGYGGLAFDPFLGSGTSAIAAHKAGLNFVGTELDEDYYKAACERFDRETAQQDMF